MIRVKITKNIIRNGALLMGMTVSQIVTAVIGLVVSGIEIVLLYNVMDINGIMTIVFFTLLLFVGLGIVKIQGLSLFKFLVLALKGPDKRPYSTNGIFTETKENSMKRKKKLFDFTNKMTIPKTAQGTIPFIEAYDNGLLLTEQNTYTLIFAFENLDYQLLRDSEQQETYEIYQKLLNALPSDVGYQEFIMNSVVNTEKLKKALIPANKTIKENILSEYVRMNEGLIAHSGSASADKVMLIALSYTPLSSIDNANVLFKYYRELQQYFSHLKSNVKQLEIEQVFKVLFDFYHPFDNIDFLLPKNIYSRGGKIKDYIAPSTFVFKAKEIEVGTSFTRVLYVRSFDREGDDGFVQDLLDNNKKITVSKHIHRMDKAEALDKVNKEILSAQERVQKRKENNHKSGQDFVPFRYLDRLRELEDLQNRLSGTNCELFEVGIFVSISAETKDELEELTLAIRSKALKHQVKLDIFVRQQEKGLNSVLPMGINRFSVKNGNNVNTYLLSDAASVLIPFSNRGYYTETGISYGMNKITNSVIVLDRTDEMNSNGFTLGCSGSGKSMFTKSEIIDVLMKYPNDEIIVVDPDNEYAPLVKEFDGEIFKLSPSSSTTLNLFDTDLSYAEEGVNAISMKSEFIMSVVEIAKGIKLSSNEKSIIDRCVKNVYQPFVQSSGNKDYIPTLEDFYNELKAQPEQEASDVAIAIELYVKGSFSNFAGVTNIDIKKKFLVMDIMEMGEQLAAVGLHVILEFLWQRVIANKQRGVRTWVWIDEFSVMFSDRSERSGDFFAKVYKRIRKHGGVITGITQNITEVIASKQAQTMLQNTEFVVLLQQAKHDLDTLIDLFELSPSQAMYLKSGEKGSGLIICGKKVIPFEKKIPQDNLIYKICSTNFKEVQKEYQTEMKNG